MCRKHKVKIPHYHKYKGTTGSGGTPAHTHGYEGKTDDVHPNVKYVEIEIFKELEVGDVVVMVSLNGGQMYYVFEKVQKEQEEDVTTN